MDAVITSTGPVRFRELGAGDYPLFAQLDGDWAHGRSGAVESYLDTRAQQLLDDPIATRLVLADVDGRLVGYTVIVADSDVHTDWVNRALRPVDLGLRPGFEKVHPHLISAAAGHAPEGYVVLVHTVTVTEAAQFRRAGWRLLDPGDALAWCDGDQDCDLHQAEPDSSAELLAWQPLLPASRMPPMWIVPAEEVDSDATPPCGKHQRVRR